MSKWLYNSLGQPVAFEDTGEVFSSEGEFIGEIIRNEVYNGYYKAEIIDDRIFVNKSKKWKFNGNIQLPGIPIKPFKPYSKPPIYLPPGLDDFDDNPTVLEN
jgi:hypothetical protein